VLETFFVFRKTQYAFRCIRFDGVNCIESLPFYCRLCLVKSRRELCQTSRTVAIIWRKGIPDASEKCALCVIVMDSLRARFPFVWPLATNSEYKSLQNLNIVMLIHCLTFADVFIVKNPFHAKKSLPGLAPLSTEDRVCLNLLKHWSTIQTLITKSSFYLFKSLRTLSPPSLTHSLTHPRCFLFRHFELGPKFRRSSGTCAHSIEAGEALSNGFGPSFMPWREKTQGHIPTKGSCKTFNSQSTQ
jgi:hypothetical protein